jgi:hypothetical protein
MTRHVKALTYRPKIDAVFFGDCRQTIRRIPKELDGITPQSPRVAVGDIITFHTWFGRPYFSIWAKRVETKVTGIRPVFNWCGVWHEWPPSCEPITDRQMDEIARLDGIEPANRIALECLLMKLNGLKDLHDTDWLIITFEKVLGEEEFGRLSA